MRVRLIVSARSCRGALLRGGLVSAALVAFVGCSSTPPVPVASAPVAPIVEDRGVIVHEEDAVVDGYAAESERNLQSSRADAEAADPRAVAEQAAAAAAKSREADSVATEAPAAPHKSSMPPRRSGGTARPGSVRKAAPVDQQAAPLFGLWSIDQTQSTQEQCAADRVLFLADGRMRVWHDGAPEDGRWSWSADTGVRTGGIERVAVELGEFELEPDGKTMVLSPDPTRRVVLVPARMFVAPPSVRPTSPRP